MNNFVFYSPTEFVFGKDAEAQVGTMVRMYGGSKVIAGIISFLLYVERYTA